MDPSLLRSMLFLQRECRFDRLRLMPRGCCPQSFAVLTSTVKATAYYHHSRTLRSSPPLERHRQGVILLA
ncbi:hypothetical protein SeMB42_g04316 [Synchytrium endobioticum]|uniref:Uncharacterized protein n=1 Tax=Synchytrium endobioticum TaxID=286115 RepID=A0A507CZM1_9FUNG|nr:hypothetical protein SeMB42_g04316 [Synchytrium endobioticum]